MRATEFIIESTQAEQKVLSQRMWPTLSKFVQSGIQKDEHADVLLTGDPAQDDAALKQFAIQHLIPLDQSNAGKFAPSIIRWYGAGEWKTGEDEEDIQLLLQQYQQFRGKMPAEIRDINKVSRTQLVGTINNIVQADKKAMLAKQKGDTALARTKTGARDYGDIGKIIIDEGDFMTVVPQSVEQSRNAASFPAGSVYGNSNTCHAGNPDKEGRSTRWCTLSANNFKSYSGKGPLFVIILNYGDAANMRMFQLCYEAGEFKNESDVEINDEEIALLSGHSGYTKLLNSLIKKHYSQYFDAA